MPGKNEPVGPELIVEYSHVIARRCDARAQVGRWSRAELDLTSWLQRQETIPGHRPWPFETVQNSANPFKWDWQRRVGGISDQPFELSAYHAGWAGLEADCPDKSFRFELGERLFCIGLGADRVGADRFGGQLNHRFPGECRTDIGRHRARSLPTAYGHDSFLMFLPNIDNRCV
jgi:hypothetical protein